MPGEVDAEDHQDENAIEDEAYRQMVVQDGADAVEFKEQPGDEESVRHQEAKMRHNE